MYFKYSIVYWNPGILERWSCLPYLTPKSFFLLAALQVYKITLAIVLTGESFLAPHLC